MTAIQPKPGFDWSHVSWGRPDSPPSVLCSYCSAGIPDESVPLVLHKDDGSAARFCDDCMSRWFGFTVYGDPPDDDA